MKKREILWESMHIDDIEDNSSLIDDEEIDDEEYYPIAGKLINTPVGIFDMNDKYNPLRQFELRIAYTNFEIDETIAETIERCDGVEAFAIIGRYRFIIGIGKLFTFEGVRKDIEELLIPQPTQQTKEVLALSSELSKNYKYWGLYQFPNGKIDSFGTESQDEFNEKVKIYQESVELSRGFLLTSEV